MMTGTRSRLFASPLVAALVVGASLVGASMVYSTANSAPTPAPPPPVNVALVNVAKLLNGLSEKAELDARNKAKTEELDGLLKTMRDEIDKIENDLKVKIAPSDYKQRLELLGKGEELAAVFKTRREVFQRQIDILEGDLITQLYSKAVATIDAFAKREGIDLVIVDDRTSRMPDLGSGSRSEVMRVVADRQVLYGRDGLDITDRLITLMNQEFASRRPEARPDPMAPAPGGGVPPAPMNPPR